MHHPLLISAVIATSVHFDLEPALVNENSENRKIELLKRPISYKCFKCNFEFSKEIYRNKHISSCNGRNKPKFEKIKKMSIEKVQKTPVSMIRKSYNKGQCVCHFKTQYVERILNEITKNFNEIFIK